MSEPGTTRLPDCEVRKLSVERAPQKQNDPWIHNRPTGF
jgi:hypothetical protein